MRIPWNIEPRLWEEHAATEVADGVYRICSNMTNMYLIEDDDGLTLVDAGLPAQMELLVRRQLRKNSGNHLLVCSS